MDIESPAAALHDREQCLARLWFLYQLPKDDPLRLDKTAAIKALEKRIAYISNIHGDSLQDEARGLENRARDLAHNDRPASLRYLKAGGVEKSIQDLVLREGMTPSPLEGEQKWEESDFFQYCEIAAGLICKEAEWTLDQDPATRQKNARRVLDGSPCLLFTALDRDGHQYYVKVLIRLDQYHKWLFERYFTDCATEIVGSASDRELPNVAKLKAQGVFADRLPWVATYNIIGKPSGTTDYGINLTAEDAIKIFNLQQLLAEQTVLRVLEVEQRPVSDYSIITQKIKRARSRGLPYSGLDQILEPQVLAAIKKIFSTVEQMGQEEYERRKQPFKGACHLDIHGGNYLKEGTQGTVLDFEKAGVTHLGLAHARTLSSSWNCAKFMNEYETRLLQTYQEQPDFMLFFKCRLLLYLIAMYYGFAQGGYPDYRKQAEQYLPGLIKKWALAD